MSLVLEVEGYPPVSANAGESLLEVCEEAGIPMDCACGGFACCNSCRVVVVRGAQHLSKLVEEEEPFLDAPDQRLGCQAMLEGSVVVRLCPGM